MRVASHTPIDEALVERMRDRLIEACDPQYLYLFGSVARGEESPGSDVDLLVVTTPPLGRSSGARGRRRSQLAGGREIPQGVLPLYGEEPPYPHNLGALLDRIEEHEEDFRAFRSAAEALSPFAVAVRYPNPESIPSETEARRLVEQVDAIRAEVQDHLGIEE